MKFKQDGYHRDGSLCIYAYDDNNVKIAVFRGYFDVRKDVIRLYPRCCLVPTKENLEKRTIRVSELL